ncbi:MAG: BrnT family toxin [Candidatus Binataceae bacterium]
MAWPERLAECEGFEWDKGNSQKIWDRHRVTPGECEEVFFNQPLMIGDDRGHSMVEDRLYALGQTDASRLIFIVFTVRDRVIRVISARDMSRKERGIYRSS